MKSVGLFFGTFDPIHKGHEAIADFFLKNFFDEVWFVVTPMTVSYTHLTLPTKA